jgi:(p)ppGpp synthase/HD superfamily hydrolase
VFSEGIERAILAALEAHAGQRRKGGERPPYAVHPLHVALLLARFGAGDELIQAGLLHDVVEDSAVWTSARVEEEFGERVAGVVAELSEDKSRSWDERKRAAIEEAPRLSEGAALVKACDQLHNLCTLLAELEAAERPEAVWTQFRGGRERTLEMARGLLEALGGRIPAPLSRELGGVLEALEAHPAR